MPCLHSVGMPLDEAQADVPWPCNAENKYIVHFPETREIISYGSGYGGNALLGKKCFALRIASVLARDDGWLAEHMLVLKLTNPAGRVALRDRRLPERLRQDEPRHARADPAGLEGRDGRRRHLLDEARPRRAPLRDQPRGRLLWRGAGHQHADQPQRDVLGRGQHHLHQYRHHARRRHLVGGHGRAARGPDRLEGPSRGRKDLGTPAAHPNSRFTAPAAQDPAIAAEWQDPAGVPIDAILFGGRRASVIPLVFQSLSWDHGVFLGSIMASETTAAADGAVGKLRRDPFAMLPFCGYNMADYFAHWLTFSKRFDETKLPKIFYVNWFRKSADGRWLWPGFGENTRVLEWVFERTAGRGEAVETAIGYVPTTERDQRRGTQRDDRGHGTVTARRPRRVAPRGAAHSRALRPVQRAPAQRAPRDGARPRSTRLG